MKRQPVSVAEWKIIRSSRYENLCRACERSMSEEEIFAMMDAR